MFQINKYDLFEGIHKEHQKHLSHKILKLDVDEDREFLKEVNLLHAIADRVSVNFYFDNVILW